jgi:RNA polymerase sigma factor (sigma-70 family)
MHSAPVPPILVRAWQGDRDALEVLIKFCRPVLYHWIARLCPNNHGEEIDDIYQETWLFLIKDNWRILRRYQPEKGEFGAFLVGVARKIAKKRHARRPKNEMPLSRSQARQPSVSDVNLQQAIQDLSMRASPAEKRFLRECLLGPADENTVYSKANHWQLSHRLLDKAWPLVYGPEIPRPGRDRTKLRKSKRLSRRICGFLIFLRNLCQASPLFRESNNRGTKCSPGPIL